MESKEISIKKIGEALKTAFYEENFIDPALVHLSWKDPAPWSDDEVLISVEIPFGLIIFARTFGKIEGVELFSVYPSPTFQEVHFDFVCKIK